MTPAQRYAEGFLNWRARRRYAYMRSLRALDRAQWADRFADPAQGLTHFERHQLAHRRRFGARGR